jgi:hypothetical protein
MKPRNLCNVSKSLWRKCSTNRTGRSRVISCHSHDIGADYLLSANTIRITDGVMCSIMAWNGTRSVLINLIRPQYVVVVVKYLKVLATYRKYGTR